MSSNEVFEVSVWSAPSYKKYEWKGKKHTVKFGFYVSKDERNLENKSDRDKYFLDLPPKGENEKELDWILCDEQKTRIKLAICITSIKTSFWKCCSELVALGDEEIKLLDWLKSEGVVDVNDQKKWEKYEPPRYKVQRKQLEDNSFLFEMLERTR